jgi:hypothetical protein
MPIKELVERSESMEDRLLSMVFEHSRWEKAVENGCMKDINPQYYVGFVILGQDLTFITELSMENMK